MSVSDLILTLLVALSALSAQEVIRSVSLGFFLALPCMAAIIVTLENLISVQSTWLPGERQYLTEQQKSYFKNPIVWFLFVYFLIGLFSGFACHFNQRFVVHFSSRLCLLLLASYSFCCGPSKPGALVNILFGFLVTGTGMAIWSVNEGINVGFAVPIGNFASLHKNCIGDICASTLIIAATAALSSKKLKAKVPLVVISSLALVGMIASQSRGAVLTTLTSMTLVLFLRKTKLLYLITFCVLSLGGLAALIALAPAETSERVLDSKQGSSFSARPYFWDMTFSHIRNHPFDIIGWGQPLLVENAPVENICNFFLQDYVQCGVVGALLMLIVLALTLRLAVRNANRLPSGPLKLINMTAIALVLARFLHGSMESFWDAFTDQAIAGQALGMVLYVNGQLEARAKALEQSGR